MVNIPKQTYFNLPESKRNRILECAVDEFAEHGYRGASISRIVKQSGIAKGSFYQYFEDKDDVYIHVFEQVVVNRKMSISSEESVKLEDVNLTQFIRELLKAMARTFFGEPRLLKIAIDYFRHMTDPAQKLIYDKYKYLQDNYFQEFIRREKEAGKIDPLADEDVLGNMLMGVGYMISNYITAQGHEDTGEEYIDDIFDKLEYILTRGIYPDIRQTLN